MTTFQKNLVVVAMSGGVDSSVAALLLKEQGMEVIGIAMKTHDQPAAEEREKSCCSARDIGDARRVCQQLDIPFYPLDFTEEFGREVIDNFAGEYGRGRTPNPCVQCNDKLKFAALLNKARQLGAYYLATGHYVQKSRDRTGRYHLLRAKDRTKDQSYFLFGLGQEQLEHLLFPVGRYTKDEVRTMAREAGLPTADKPESQEICFVPANDYASFIEKERPEALASAGQARRPAGSFVSPDGMELGTHQGIHAYTVGQRRGLGVAAGERLYVSEIVPEQNKVVLGSRESLLKEGLVASRVRWVVPGTGSRPPTGSGMEVDAVLRYHHPGIGARVWMNDDQTARVDFTRPEGPVTPGQAVVFYQGEELLGGGWIEKGIG